MDFRAQNHFSADIADVITAYGDPDLVLALGPLAPLSAGELLEHRQDVDRVQVRVRYAYQGDLPPGASAIVEPSKLTWVQVTELDLVQRRALIVLQPDHYSGRLQARAVERFEAAPLGGTNRTVEGELTVKVLVVGRAVERALVSGLQEWLANEAVAVDRWLGEGMPTPPELDADA
jgi:hypothetical protein